MRILSVRIKNLNSLAGEWLVDFTDPAFATSGIFAITGPTGAGKTTILDGICLALYGQTPRLDRLNQSTNDLMSRGTAECSAEVSFETTKGRFRCTWQQRRARNTVNGALQAPKRELVDATTDIAIATKINDVSNKIEECTGMDFDRFTRSMLLAQGKFAAFLQAGINERSPILEQITGTEVYGRISEQAFQRFKQESELVKQLESENATLELLTEEQLVELQKSSAELKSTSDNLITSIEQIQVLLQWHWNIERLQGEISDYEKHQLLLASEIQNFEADQKRLVRDGLARRLDVAYANLTTTRNEARKASDESKQLRETMIRLQTDKANAETEHQNAIKLASEQKEAYLSIAPTIEEVRLLDADIKQRRDGIDQLQQDLNQEKKRLETCESKITSLQKDVSTIKATQDQTNAYLNEHAQDGLLVEQYSGIEAEFCTWISQSNDLDNRRKDCDTDQGRLKSAQAKESEAAQDVIDKQSQLEKVNRDFSAAREALDRVLAGKSLELFEKEKDQLVELKRLRSIIKSLDAHRAALKPGDACPLCGSIEHPYANGETPQPDELDGSIREATDRIVGIKKLKEDIEQLDRNKQLAQKDVDSAINKRDNAKLHRENITDQLAQKRRSYEDLEKSTHGLLESLRKKLLPFSCELEQPEQATELLDILGNRRERWQKYTQQQQTIQQQIVDIQTELSKAQTSHAEIQNGVQTKKESLDQKETELQQRVRMRRELFGEKNPVEESKRLQKQVEDSERLQRTTQEKSQAVSLAHKEAEASLRSVVTRLEAATKLLTEQESQFREALSELGFDNEVDYCAAKLKEQERSTFEAKQRDLDNRKHALEESLKTRRENLRIEQEKKRTDKVAAVLLAEKLDFERRNSECHQQLGEIKSKLSHDDENRKKWEAKGKEIANRKKEFEKWQSLNELIGSGDGRKFRNFAQGLTFERLIQFANQQLSSMTDRYLLVADKDAPLELNVIDNYQAGEHRTTKNLSGGESFIVSLSLALGLSRMASHKVRVDSLFLDEGFGTLDEDALNIALDTLSGLQQQGKLIGVISHVPALKERIGTQIKVSLLGSGRSKLEGPGCSKVGA